MFPENTPMKTRLLLHPEPQNPEPGRSSNNQGPRFIAVLTTVHQSMSDGHAGRGHCSLDACMEKKNKKQNRKNTGWGKALKFPVYSCRLWSLEPSLSSPWRSNTTKHFQFSTSSKPVTPAASVLHVSLPFPSTWKVTLWLKYLLPNTHLQKVLRDLLTLTCH